MRKKNWIIAMASVGLLAAGSIAQACTLTAWSGGSTGDAAEVDVRDGFSRYSGECAMETTNGVVSDFSPGNEGQMRFRFYVKRTGASGKGATPTTIFRAYSDQPGTASVLSITYNGAEFNVSSDLGGGTSTGAMAANNGQWNSIEVDWGSTTADTISVWVNADSSGAASGTATIGSAGTIDSVSLGVVADGDGATYAYDDYQANRTTSPDRLCICDTNVDGSVSITDVTSIVSEILEQGNDPATRFVNTGNADCNNDAGVSVTDVTTGVSIILGPTGGSCAAQP